MAHQRTSMTEEIPADPVGQAVADAVADLVPATVELAYARVGASLPAQKSEVGMASATGAGPSGWQVRHTVRLHDRVARLIVLRERSSLTELVEALPHAAVTTAARFAGYDADGAVLPSGSPLRRVLRDTVAAEILAGYLTARSDLPVSPELIPSTIEFLLELSGTRVESHDLTHGVVIADVLRDTPRLEFTYPGDIRTAKRAPLLFDGQDAVLVVDPGGRARTELERHRIDRLTVGGPAGVRAGVGGVLESGSVVADATSVLGGIGFFLRADRSIWTFVDGHPLLVRRSEHWTAFPLELTTSIEHIIGGGSVAALVARAALVISAQPRGAILAIVDDRRSLDRVVSMKDRYDLRNDTDPAAMRPETRLHHLINGENLDDRTLVRLATLDGATVIDRSGHLLAYGAIVASADSEHEGARTAAAKTLSQHASVVLKVSVDGDITIFRDGTVLTTLLSGTGREAMEAMT